MRVLATSYHRRPKPKRGKTGVIVLPVSQWEIYVIQGKKGPMRPRTKRKPTPKPKVKTGVDAYGFQVFDLSVFDFPTTLRRIRGGRL